LLVLETELLELKANPKKRARGAVIESEIARGMGPVAWVLVRSGTLRVGDIFLAGETYGRVRAMHDSQGRSVLEAGPSTPVVVQGFSAPSSAGDQFVIVEDERTARSIAEQRAHRAKMKSGPAVQHVTLEDFHAQLMAGERTQLNVVLKADVQGSVDVLESTLADAGNEEVRVNLVHTGVGSINESDILLASASDAVVLGFGVEPTAKAERLAETEGVAIRTYRIIYELVEDVRKSLEGLLAPEEREVITGHAEIRQVYRSSALGAIAGCMMTDGEIRRDSKVRVLRGNDAVHTGRVASLRRERDSVTSIQAGFECGIKIEGFDDIKEGDIIEAFQIESVAKALT
jgi:translation initiation factor IF-2